MSNLIFTASFFLSLFGANWESMDEKIDDEFPTIQFISTDQLRARLDEAAENTADRINVGNAAEKSSLPLLIDVRELAEYQVSHLPQALNIITADEIAALYPDKETEIVVYCSVGYRSGAVAAELNAQGYTNVSNLRHSLFEWANKTYPMVNDQGPTDKAHPFNRIWGSLLNPDYRRYQP